ncbi:MAG: putative zinc-binding metallopeptidase [Pseudomonadota bacterium]
MSHQANLQSKDLWGQRVDQLGLCLERSPIWPLIEQLYAELAGAGIDLRPRCFIASEWGCPDGLPIVGIPFFLVDSRFYEYEEEHADDLEDASRILMGLRHEAGHALNYAYLLHKEPEWTAVFGDFAGDYRDDYLPVPFCPDFVRHLPGWYAQKHPDEDFAETFAVWLTPGSNWRERYAGTGALRKLEYVDRMMAQIGKLPPIVDPASIEPDESEIQVTLSDFYRQRTDEDSPPVEDLAGSLDQDFRELFSAEKLGIDAATLVWDRRQAIMRAVASYTGARLFVVKSLLVFIARRLQQLGLRSAPGREAEAIIGLTALASMLVANYLRIGNFGTQSQRKPGNRSGSGPERSTGEAGSWRLLRGPVLGHDFD